MSERVVAIDVGGTYLKGALVDRRGHAVEQERRPSAVAHGPEAVVEAVVGLAQELIAAEKASPAGVGLAVPGLVDERARTVINAANVGWRDLEIGSIVEERLGMAVTVVHDVRAGALAEGLLGAARDCSDYLLITLGTGIGAAVVIGGRPYTGAHGVGGEFGHIAIEPRGPICGCGHPGCLEALASARHVSSRYQIMTGGSKPVGAEEVAARAAGGDAVAEEVWSMAIDALATGVANYAALLDPERVVVGGGMAAAGDHLFVPLRNRLAVRMRFGDPPPVVPAALGQEAGRHGAAIAAWRAAGIDEAELSAWKP
jgi:glucokinase